MKKVLYFALAIFGTFTFVSCDEAKNSENSEEKTEIVEEEKIEESTTTGFYGEKITEDGAIAMSELKASLGEQDSANFKVTGKIAETCLKKGCWMTIDMEGEETMRVRFKDYEFFVPKSGMEGKEVILDDVLNAISIALVK